MQHTSPSRVSPPQSETIYRVDKFVVPSSAREAFIAKICITHELLRTLAGFKQDVILEKTTGAGEFNFVTLVAWDNAKAIESAKAAVAALHRKMDFNPQKMFSQLEIRADLANYRTVEL